MTSNMTTPQRGLRLRTRLAAIGVTVGLLAGACGADEPDSNIPQADGGGGGCEESGSDDNARSGDHQPDSGAWEAVAQTGGWEPATEPYAVGEQFTVGDWELSVIRIDYDATELIASTGAVGDSYNGKPVEAWQWVLVEAVMTYGGPEESSAPTVDLESGFVDRNGELHPGYQCPTESHTEMPRGESAAGISLVPVPPEQVVGGLWGVGPADPAIDDLIFVR
jgi:hypothetical protein